MWTTKSLIALLTLAAVCAPVTGFAHVNAGLPQASLLAGLLHPLTGLDHIAVLLLLGVLLALPVAIAPRLRQRHTGLLTLVGLLAWIALHYSGAHFFVYAIGWLVTSLGLIGTGVVIGYMGIRHIGIGHMGPRRGKGVRPKNR